MDQNFQLIGSIIGAAEEDHGEGYRKISAEREKRTRWTGLGRGKVKSVTV